MNNKELQLRQVLIVEDIFSENDSTLHNAVMRLADALADRSIAVQFAQSVCEAYPIAATNMDLDAFLVATDMEFEKTAERRTLDFLKHVRERQAGVPVFLFEPHEELNGFDIAGKFLLWTAFPEMVIGDAEVHCRHGFLC